MLACYRRIPNCISKNVRTLFSDIPKLSPANTRSWAEKIVMHCTTDKTATNKHNYRMVRVRDHIQLLLISNPKIENQDEVNCAIKIGVGNEDDPSDCAGLAHLCEHVSCVTAFNLYKMSMAGLTEKNETLFSFLTTQQNYAKAIGTWSRVLFSTSDLETIDGVNMQEIVGAERKSVDNEYNEKRCLHNMNHVVVEILKSQSLNLAKFANGNRKTLKNDVGHLLRKLNEHRKLIRQRPAVICIYSAQVMNMENVLKALNVDEFLVSTDKLTKAKPIDWNQRLQSKKDFSKHLIIVKSDDDRLRLDIHYPLLQLDRKELNTMRFICEMIKCPTKGFLLDHLFDKKLATDCMANVDLDILSISVYLTLDGLKKIKDVHECVQCYLHFLHRTWHRFDAHRRKSEQVALEELNEKARMFYTEDIANHLDVEAVKFNEMDLMQMSDSAKLIEDRLLKNKNVVYAIVDLDPQKVFRTLGKWYGDHFPNNSLNEARRAEPELEPIYGAQFHIVETELFKPVNLKTDMHKLKVFKFVTSRKLDENELKQNKHDYLSLIHEPSDAAFQRLFATNFKFEVRPCWSAYDPGYFKNTYKMVSYFTKNECDTDFLNTSDEVYKISKEAFSLCREHILGELSMEMTITDTFARSLMQTAVMNIHNKRRSEPLPLQYDTLNRMTIRNYRHRIKELREKNRIIDIRKEQTAIQPYSFDEKFFITSINANEAITATLFFFQTTEHIGINDLRTCTLLRAIDTRDKHGLYTISFEPERFGHVDGLLFALFSVEKRDNGSGEQILKLCDEFWHDVAQDITKYPNYEELRLQELYDSMMTKRILIQVIGNQEPKVNKAKTFKCRFSSWLKSNEATFREMIRIPSSKGSN